MSMVTTLNAIRSTASNAYQTTVPLATMSSITEVGNAVLTAPQTIQNEFISALVNLIGLQLLNTREFGHSLLDLRKGSVEYGTTIEDIFVEMAMPHSYTTGTRPHADGTPGKLEDVPDQFAINKAIAETAFYSVIFGRQYWKTIHQNDLKRAFRGEDGLNRFISAIMLSLKNGEAYDDYRVTIALLARQIEAGKSDQGTTWKGDIHLLADYNALYSKSLTSATALTDSDFLTYMLNQIKKWSNRLSKPRSDLNCAGVTNWIPKSEQRILLLGDIQSDLDTNLYANTFNPDRLEVSAVDEIDCWYSIGADDGTPAPTIDADDIVVKATMGLTNVDEEENETVSPCLGMIYSPNMVKLYNKSRISDTAKNARGHYYNIFDTVEDYCACSPFENFTAFFLD